MMLAMAAAWLTGGRAGTPEIWYSCWMADHASLLDRLERVCRASADLATLWRASAEVFATAVPHFEAPCFFTVDPESRLITSHFQEGLPEIPAAWLGREYAQPEFNSLSAVLASPEGFGTLHDATGGRPELARKYHEEMQPFGCEQELVVALRTRHGEPWGAVGLYRQDGRPLFERREIDFVRAAAPALAEAARRTLLAAQAAEPDLPDAPGLVVLDDALALVSASPTAASWLRELAGDVHTLPPTLLAVAGSALGPDPASAVVRVVGVSGAWLTVHGTRLDGPAGRQAAVVLEAARPAHLAAVLMRVYGLTPREQEVTRLVLRGATTTAAARRLEIAEDTVQKHVQRVFGKTGARSRGELVSLLFRTHYEPRVRDNERRTAAGRPARHGPMPG